MLKLRLEICKSVIYLSLSLSKFYLSRNFFFFTVFYQSDVPPQSEGQRLVLPLRESEKHLLITGAGSQPLQCFHQVERKTASGGRLGFKHSGFMAGEPVSSTFTDVPEVSIK